MRPIDKAREALNALPRCGARSRQTGSPCQLPGTGAGGRCRFHGGASTGRPKIHGRYSKAAKLERDWLRLLLGVLAVIHNRPVRGFRPGSMRQARVDEILRLKLYHRAKRQ